MCRFWLTVVLAVLPALICKADTPVLDQNSHTTIPSNLLKTKVTPQSSSPRALELRYGHSHLTFDSGAMKGLKIDHQSEGNAGQSFMTIKTAEAAEGSGDFTIRGFEALCNSINEISRLSDLKSVVSQEYYQLLREKVNGGSSQYTVLSMLQVMRPSNIYIMDFQVQNNEAVLLVKGGSLFGPMQGTVRLIKEDGLWKIAKENWYAAHQDFHGTFGASLNRFAQADKYALPKTGGVMAEISPESRINTNFLALSKVPYQKSRRAFTFVFLMNKEKATAPRPTDVHQMVKTAYAKSNPHTHMHVLWTGSRRLMPEQKVQHQYPIDFSIANYDDGYSPGQWNLILPDKKPREVVISVLWNF